MSWHSLLWLSLDSTVVRSANFSSGVQELQPKLYASRGTTNCTWHNKRIPILKPGARNGRFVALRLQLSPQLTFRLRDERVGHAKNAAGPSSLYYAFILLPAQKCCPVVASPLHTPHGEPFVTRHKHGRRGPTNGPQHALHTRAHLKRLSGSESTCSFETRSDAEPGGCFRKGSCSASNMLQVGRGRVGSEYHTGLIE